MNGDSNLKPQVPLRVYELYEQLLRAGFTENDIVVLIQERTKPRLTKTEIRQTLLAARKLERILERILTNLKLLG